MDVYIRAIEKVLSMPLNISAILWSRKNRQYGAISAAEVLGDKYVNVTE